MSGQNKPRKTFLQETSSRSGNSISSSENDILYNYLEDPSSDAIAKFSAANKHSTTLCSGTMPETIIEQDNFKFAEEISNVKEQKQAEVPRVQKKKYTTVRCNICLKRKKFRYQYLTSLIDRKKYECQPCKQNNIMNLYLKNPSKDGSNSQISKANSISKVQNGEHLPKEKGIINQNIAKFAAKYPEHLAENGTQILFPVEDALFFVYPQILPPLKKKIPEPKIDQVISPKLLGDLLQIENFVQDFSELFTFKTIFNKYALFRDLQSEQCLGVFEQIISNLLKIFLIDQLQKTYQPHKENFFIIMFYFHQTNRLMDITIRVWQQIFMSLSYVPRFQKIFSHELIQINSVESKIKLLKTLIEGLYETSSFHRIMDKKTGLLKTNYKEMTDKDIELKSLIGERYALLRILSEMEDEKKRMTNLGIQNLQKQTLCIYESQQKLQTITSAIDKYKVQVEDLNKQILFEVTSILFLGQDRHKSQYFLNKVQPNKIYVKFNSGLLHSSENYRYYQGIQGILELMFSLNCKGINEKALFEKIKGLMQSKIITQVQSEEDNIESIANNSSKQVLSKPKPTLQLIRKTIYQIQQGFSEYLQAIEKKWGYETARSEILESIRTETGIKQLKKALVKLIQKSVVVIKLKWQTIRIQAKNTEDDHNIKQRQLLTDIRWMKNFGKYRKPLQNYIDGCSSFSGLWIGVYFLKCCVQDKLLKCVRSKQFKKKKEQSPKKYIKHLDNNEKSKDSKHLHTLESIPLLIKKNKRRKTSLDCQPIQSKRVTRRSVAKLENSQK